MSTGLLADIQQRVARPPSPAPAPTGGLLADIQTRARTTPLTDVQRAGIEAELGQWRARGQRGVLVRAQALAPSARDYLYRALHASGAERRAATGQYTTGSGLHLGKPPAGAAETGFWRALEHVPPEHQAAVAPLLMEAFQPLTSRGPRVAAQTGPYVTKLQPPEFDPRAARTLQDMPPEYRASSAAMTAWLQDPDAVRPLEERHPGFLAGTTTLEPTARAAKFQKRLTRFVQAALYADQRERARRQGGNVATQMLSEADEMLANLVKVAPEAVKLFSGNLPRGGAARQYINARQRGDIIAQSEYRKRFTPLDELVLQAHALQASKNAAERIVGVAAHEPIRQLLAREESPAIVGAVEYMDKFLLGIPSYLKGEPLVPAVTPAQQAAAGGAYFAALMTSPLWRPFYAPGRMAVAAIGRKLGLAAGKLSLPATTAFFRFAETRVGAHLLNAMANVPKAIGGIAGAQLLGPLTAAERKRIEGGGDFGGILRARIGRAVKTMREPSPQLLVLAFAIGLARPMQIRPETYERLGVLETNRAQALALMKMWPGVSERWMLNFVKGWKRAAKEAGRPLTGRTRIAGPGADFRELMFRTFPTRPADAILDAPACGKSRDGRARGGDRRLAKGRRPPNVYGTSRGDLRGLSCPTRLSAHRSGSPRSARRRRPRSSPIPRAGRAAARESDHTGPPRTRGPHGASRGLGDAGGDRIADRRTARGAGAGRGRGGCRDRHGDAAGHLAARRAGREHDRSSRTGGAR